MQGGSHLRHLARRHGPHAALRPPAPPRRCSIAGRYSSSQALVMVMQLSIWNNQLPTLLQCPQCEVLAVLPQQAHLWRGEAPPTSSSRLSSEAGAATAPRPIDPAPLRAPTKSPAPSKLAPLRNMRSRHPMAVPVVVRPPPCGGADDGVSGWGQIYRLLLLEKPLHVLTPGSP